MAMSAIPGPHEGEWPEDDDSPVKGARNGEEVTEPRSEPPAATLPHGDSELPPGPIEKPTATERPEEAETTGNPGDLGPDGIGWVALDDNSELELLPCGRQLDKLWETWTDDPASVGHDPHVTSCPHCATALGELRLLDEFVREELDRDEGAAAAPTLPTGTKSVTERVTERVMDIVRTELRPGASVPLGDRDEDHWITETAAARTLRTAAERERGVEAGSCRITPASGGDWRSALPGARLPRGPVRVRIGIIAPLRRRVAVPRIADAVRHQIVAAADTELGMRVATVDVVVVDVREEWEEGAQ